jgi:succinate dehydrogenase / fumarate reductase cytochrome b subunit
MDDVVSQPSPGVGKVVSRMHGSTIGQKALMAVTGLLLVGFVLGHMLGHLQMFGPDAREHYNAYAHFLQSLGEILWAMRLGLLAAVILHIFSAIQVMRRNRAARPIQYEMLKSQASSFASRTMRQSGVILMLFIVWHLLHFTIMSAADTGFKDPATGLGPLYNLKGQMVPDVYGRMVFAFSNRPVITAIYVACVGLLGLHLSHGISSAVQTLGVQNQTYRPFTRKAGPAIGLLVFLGFACVPIAILAGIIK